MLVFLSFKKAHYHELVSHFSKNRPLMGAFNTFICIQPFKRLDLQFLQNSMTKNASPRKYSDFCNMSFNSAFGNK